MQHSTAIYFFVVGIIALIGFCVYIAIFTIHIKKIKKEGHTTFNRINPNSNFIMRFWGNAILYIIPFGMFCVALIFISISFEPLFIP
ncbi:hypothetical protein [Spiroplasma endosymbiont of Aspidapion aeneum]|uniref:hypothetical protein n=1 Tax=Spiroplasma endosymbiont of Aspidapion aeneum TaxID=3066276 RepID=UPI00313E2499